MLLRCYGIFNFSVYYPRYIYIYMTVFMYGTCKKKNDTNIRNVFPKCVFGVACTANRKASSTNWKASSEERRAHTHISFRNAVQLRLWIFRSCVCVFRGAFVTAKQNSKWKGFRKCASFLRTRTVWWVVGGRIRTAFISGHAGSIFARIMRVKV